MNVQLSLLPTVVRIGKRSFPFTSYAEVSAAYRATIEANDLGASQTPSCVILNGSGRKVAKTMPDRSGHDCGTVACIGGWAVALKNRVGGKIRDLTHLTPAEVFREASKHLGISGVQRYDLLIPDIDISLREIPMPAAVSVLRHLAETGEVDWKRALAEATP